MRKDNNKELSELLKNLGVNEIFYLTLLLKDAREKRGIIEKDILRALFNTIVPFKEFLKQLNEYTKNDNADKEFLAIYKLKANWSNLTKSIVDKMITDLEDECLRKYRG